MRSYTRTSTHRYTHTHTHTHIQCELQSTTELRLEQRTEWDFESPTLAPLFSSTSLPRAPASPLASRLPLLQQLLLLLANFGHILFSFNKLKEGSIFSSSGSTSCTASCTTSCSTSCSSLPSKSNRGIKIYCNSIAHCMVKGMKDECKDHCHSGLKIAVR